MASQLSGCSSLQAHSWGAQAHVALRCRCCCTATPTSVRRQRLQPVLAVSDPGASSSNGRSTSGNGSSRAAVAAGEEAAPGSSGAFEERLRAAYQSGYKRGYLEGAKVKVDVTVNAPSSGGSSSSNESDGLQQGRRDTVVKSIVKGLVWRLFSTCVTVAVAMVLLKDSLQPEDVLKFGGAEFAAKLLMYVLFERLWLLV